VKRLGAYELEKMFKFYCEQQSLSYVARKTGHCRNTCKRYQLSEDWDKRFAEIKTTTLEIVKEGIIETRAEQTKRHLGTMEFIVNKAMEALKTQKFKTAEGASAAIARAILVIAQIHELSGSISDKPKLLRMPLAPPLLKLPAEPAEVSAEIIEAEPVETIAAPVETVALEHEPVKELADTTSIFDDDNDFFSAPAADPDPETRRRDKPGQEQETALEQKQTPAPRQAVTQSNQPGIGSAPVVFGV